MAKFKLRDEHISVFEKQISVGVPKTHAASNCGLAFRTVFTYLKRGREVHESGKKPQGHQEKMCLKLHQALMRGQSAFVYRNLVYIQNAAPQSWQAAAWLLERREPNHFSKTEKISGKLETKRPESEKKEQEELVSLVKAMVEDLKGCQTPSLPVDLPLLSRS